MGLLDRLTRLIRSNINDLIARAENPEKMLIQIIEDMRRQLAQAKQEVAVAIADERKLRAQFDESRSTAEEWERRARLAIREGRDDLARQALMRGQEHAQHARDLEAQWRNHRDETEKLKSSLRQLNAKIEEAKRKKNLLIAKQKRAEAQKRIHDTMQGLQDKSAFRAFDQMTEKIEEAERRAVASAEVTEELTGDTLVSEFKALEAGGDAAVDDKLLALKASMGMLPAAEPDELKALGSGSDSAAAADEIPEAELRELFEGGDALGDAGDAGGEGDEGGDASDETEAGKAGEAEQTGG
ncbi:PspA/IM30 family protein [Candidatus Palauibacter sp.]|uniref:PspA/IM30 family protein n=1 Tax=Candidatus Palauibacter sp. TaxID=3101350 RepID=UPI003AF25679